MTPIIRQYMMAAGIGAGIGLLSAVAGCPTTPTAHADSPAVAGGFPPNVWHDDQRNVTCWTFGTIGVSCLPDRAFTPVGQ